MKNKGLLIVSILMLSGWFAACKNNVMETWWEDNNSRARTARYAIFQVDFDANGGYPEPGSQMIVSGQRIAKVHAMTNSNPALPGFAGWYDENDVRWDFATRTVTRNITLHAVWNLGYVTVNFETNGGISAGGPSNPDQPQDGSVIAPLRITSGSLIPEPAPLRKSGSGFDGWYEDPSFNGEPWDFFDNEKNVVSSDITLYAKWHDVFYTVNFEANGGNPVPRSPMIIADGSRVVEPFAMYRPGYGFGGWFTEAAFRNQWDFFDNEKNVVASDITLYARWVANDYTVTFDADGGSPAPPRQIVAHGFRVTRPSIMRNQGNHFTGWYTNEARTEEWDFNDTVMGDITLYAGWEPGEYNIIFDLSRPPDAQGSISTPVTQGIAKESRIIEPLPQGGTNWSFYGWYYNRNPNFNPNDTANINIGSYRNDYLVPWDFETPLYDDDDDASLGAIPTYNRETSTLTLYARWVRSSVGDMVWVQKGSFTMGAEGSGTSPTRDISMDGFFISRYEVTQEEYKDVIESLPSDFFSGTGISFDPSQRHIPDTMRLPVERVSWFDTLVYCNQLSELQELDKVYTNINNTTSYVIEEIASNPSGKFSISSVGVTVTADWSNNGYRLPTEAEWEYAARGGHGSPQDTTYAGSNTVDDVAWYNGNSGMWSHVVGSLRPNILGLYDMSGNVCEWVWDWYAPYSNIENRNALDNPRGPTTSTLTPHARVRRGGSWNNAVNNVRSVVRNNANPSDANFVNGFRVVRGPREREIY